MFENFNNFFKSFSNLGMAMNNNTLFGLGSLGSQLYNGIPNIINAQGSDKKLNTLNTVSNILDTSSNLLFRNVHQNDSALTSNINNGIDAISSSFKAFKPIGTFINDSVKIGNFANDTMTSLGLGTDQQTKTDKILAAIPFLGALNIGKKTQDFSVNQDTINNVGSSYSGSVNSINDAADKANKAYGIFSNGSRKSANDFIDKMRVQQNTMTNISNKAKDLQNLGNQVGINTTNYQNVLNGGFDPRFSMIAKNGAKLEMEEWEPILVEQVPEKFQNGGVIEWEPIIDLDIEKFKQGGKMNVIPEGSLHARLHHMDNDSNITKKGIPVIDNDGEQQAEIELNEIIFNLDTTKKLEEFYKDGSDEAAIKAGKLLVQEILFNTDDRTGLIDTLKKGGKINGSEYSTTNL